MENESKEILRSNWKNEMEMHVNKTMPRIASGHLKENYKWFKFSYE
jgi:hypothetical protein